MKKTLIIIGTIIAMLTTVAVIAYASGNTTLTAHVVQFKIFVNGEEQNFESPVVMIDNRTYIPLREVGEVLGMNVEWCGDNQEISISSPQETEDIKEWEALYRFEEDGLWGYKDAAGKIIVAPQFRRADEFSEGLAFVRGVEGREYQTGFIDAAGNLVISLPAVISAHRFSEGLAFVRGVEGREDQIGYIDTTGNLVIPLPTVISADRFSDGFALVRIREWDWDNEMPLTVGTPGPLIFIDRTGENVFGMEFGTAVRFVDGLARVGVSNRNWAFIDTTGENAFGMEFRHAQDFIDGYARVTLLDGTNTYIDRAGNLHLDRRW